jgi:hypothetical protein
MNTRVIVRAALLAAVFGAVALFFAIGLRRLPPPSSAPLAPAAQPAR